MKLQIPGDRYINITGDPAELLSVDGAAECEPEQVGLSKRAVERMATAMTLGLFKSRAHPAVTFCLRRQGQIVIKRSIGYAQGLAPKKPLAADARLAQPDTPVCLFSGSKAIIGLLMHKLAEEGGIDLDAPVSRYIPEFSGGGKTYTTIAQVLSHQGGFPYFSIQDENPTILADWQACVERICAMPADPGGQYLAYHAFTGGYILGEIICRVAGQSVNEYLDSRIRQPMGMRYFRYGLAPEQRAGVAENHVAGQRVRWPVSRWVNRALSVPFEQVVDISNQAMFMDAVIPSGNLYATAEELSRFYDMLLAGGVYKGQCLFKPDTLARAMKPVSRPKFDRTVKTPLRYSEGLILGMNPVGPYGPFCGSAYGHLGFTNIMGWADPRRGISAGLLTTGKALLGGHLYSLSRGLSLINHYC